MPRSLVAGAALLWSASLAAQDAPRIARYVPAAPNAAHVFVMDSAHVLSAATVAALQDSALALQRETGADVAWVTLPTLGRRPIEEAAVYLGRTWKIGSAGAPGDALRNRGLLVLYIPDKTKTAGSNFRVEVGRGLEGTITDSRSRAISNAMRNDLRARRYDAAYLAGWNAAAALVREDFAAAGKPVVATKRGVALQQARHHVAPVLAVAVGIVFLVLLAALIVASRRRGDDPPGMTFWRGDPDDDDESRRRGSSSSSWSSSGDSGSGGSSSGGSSDGGSFGGGGGFGGGGSSDSI